MAKLSVSWDGTLGKCSACGGEFLTETTVPLKSKITKEAIFPTRKSTCGYCHTVHYNKHDISVISTAIEKEKALKLMEKLISR